MPFLQPIGLTLVRIVSGGQTGVDRAALDVALAAGLSCGGWCPAGRRAEDGVIPKRYPLRETPTAEYAERTHLNVRDSDATLILARERRVAGGTALTQEFAEALGRPCLVLDPRAPDGADKAARWLIEQQVRVLNVAGPRESTEPGIYEEAFELLSRLFGEAPSPRKRSARRR